MGIRLDLEGEAGKGLFDVWMADSYLIGSWDFAFGGGNVEGGG